MDFLTGKEPEMKIELRKIEDVHPYEGNPRIHNHAVVAVAASLKEFGFRQPIVVDAAGVIIVGHARLAAAGKLGLPKVPVHVATDLSLEQVKAYRIADNQTGSLSEWNYELLPVELAGLQKANYDLGLLGFDPDALAQLMDGDIAAGLTDPDEVPEPPDEAITQMGDLWVLGGHRLLCGDSAKTADVDRLLDGATIHLVNSDPPYNVKVEPRSNNAVAAGLDKTHHQKFDEARFGKRKPTDKKLRPKDRPLENDFMSDEDFAKTLRAWFGQFARVLEPGRAFYIWGGYANLANYPSAMSENELYFSQAVVWDKQHPVLTRKDFMGGFELAFYGWRLGAAHKFFGPANATDLWHVKKVSSQNMVHLTEKPVELAVKAILYSCKSGENVLDLFGGSGSTLIGCEQTGRRAYLMEIDALYCDVIVQRWENFTGKKAVKK